jgi:type II secretory pathway component PulM
MKKYFDQLRPSERRLVVGVLVVLFLVLNWVYVVPHFSDLTALHQRADAAEGKLKNYNRVLAEKPELERSVKQFESEGQFVELEDQGINFLRTIQSQSQASGIAMVNPSRQITHTNDVFFIEQVQNVQVTATDEKLVNFLVNLSTNAAMIRVRDLDLQPDQPRQQLIANIRLVANYQKNPPAAAGKTSTAKAK